MKISKEIQALFSLLDDEDEDVVIDVMAEMLYSEEDIQQLLAYFQESDSPLVRRRVHQLQAALTMRDRRRNFHALLNDSKTDPVDALLEIHLQWFDNDSRQLLMEQWMELVAAADDFGIMGMKEIAEFMRSWKINAVAENIGNPELYCIGSVLGKRTGALSLCCLTTMALAHCFGIKLECAVLMDEFCLTDGTGAVLFPGRYWLIMPPGQAPEVTIEPGNMCKLMRFCAGALFGNALNSDSFRYVQTLTQALTGNPDGEMPTTFPYPYIPAEEEEEDDDEDDEDAAENSHPQ